MKKKYLLVLLLILCIFTLTGCGSKSGSILSGKKTMTCTKEEKDEDGYSSTETMVINYNSTKVLKIKAVNISETDPEYTELQMEFGNEIIAKLNEVNGMDMKYELLEGNKIKATLEIDYEKYNPKQAKEVLGDMMDEDDDDIYSGKDVTIDEFKERNLEGYSCK